MTYFLALKFCAFKLGTWGLKLFQSGLDKSKPRTKKNATRCRKLEHVPEHVLFQTRTCSWPGLVSPASIPIIMIAIKLNQRDIHMRQPSSHYPTFKHSMPSQTKLIQFTIVKYILLIIFANWIIKRPSPSSIQCPLIVCLGWRCTHLLLDIWLEQTRLMDPWLL